MNINKIILLLLLNVLISACAAYAEKDVNSSASNLIMCEEPRPQICTREYNPVCATYTDGSKKTGSTGCTACAEYAVVGYTMGACETDAAE